MRFLLLKSRHKVGPLRTLSSKSDASCVGQHFSGVRRSILAVKVNIYLDFTPDSVLADVQGLVSSRP